jgi:hypothetical protein
MKFQKSSLAAALLVILTLSIFTIPSTAMAGAGSSAGGADNLVPEDGSAWFPGAGKEIKICYQVASDFGAPAGVDYQSLISDEFQVWQKYLAQKHAEDGVSPAAQISFNLNFIASCDGSQDLAFYFGIDNDDVKTGKGDFSNPLGFAYRKNFDRARSWGNGFIWLKKADASGGYAQLWSNVDQIKVIVLHEIGHVLGNGHFSGTIMDAGIAYVINDSMGGSTKQVHYYASHVDGPSNQLYWCLTCSNEVKGTIGVAKHWESIPGFDPKITFKRFVGRAPVGKIHAALQMQFQDNDQHPFKTLSVTYSDDHGSKVIPFEMRIGGNSFDGSNGTQAFVVVTFAPMAGLGLQPDTAAGHSVQPERGIMVQGYARDALGKRVPISVYLNTTDRPSWAEIDYADGLNDLPFFRGASSGF